MTASGMIIVLVVLASVCPLIAGHCITVYKYGQKVSDCKNAKLEALPTYLAPDIKILQFQNNSLKILTSHAFHSYQSLQEIHLTNNRISQIERRAFEGLLNLQELDLTSNKLSRVPSKAFTDTPYLRTLILKDNPIGSINGSVFFATPYLDKLVLENCSISYLSPDAFQGLPKLRELNLMANHLTSLDPSAQAHMPPSMTVIRLAKNPWRCDCKLRWFKVWLVNTHVNWEFGSNTPVCSNPAKLERLRFSSVKPEQFACPAHVTKPNQTNLAVHKSATVTITCIIRADPIAEVQWFFNKKQVNPNLNGSKYFITKTGQETMTYMLSIHNFKVSDAGRYQCLASNEAGSDRANFNIRLYTPPITTTVALPTETSSPDVALSYATIIGISAGASLFLLLLGCFICYGLKRRDRRNTYRVRDYKKPQKGKKKKRKNQEPLFEGKSDELDGKNDTKTNKRNEKIAESRTIKVGNGHATTVIDVDSSTETEPLNPIPPIPPPPKPMRLHQTTRETTPDLIRGDRGDQDKELTVGSPYPGGSKIYHDDIYTNNSGKAKNDNKYGLRQDKPCTSPTISHPNVSYRKLPNNIPAPPASARPFLSSISSRGTNSPVNGQSLNGGRGTPTHSGRNTPTSYSSSPVHSSVGFRGNGHNGHNLHKSLYDQKENNLNGHTNKENNKNSSMRDKKSPSPDHPPRIYTEDEPEPVKIVLDKEKTDASKVNNKKNHPPKPGEKDDFGTAV